MIAIVLGKDAAADTFTISEALLVAASADFQKVVMQTFREGQNAQIELSEEDSEIFGLVNE